MNKKKPCVSSDVKTKFHCPRCLTYWKTKQKLTSHMNRKNKCEIIRNITVVKTEREKTLELELAKLNMLNDRKKLLDIKKEI